MRDENQLIIREVREIRDVREIRENTYFLNQNVH